jgi:hypothetical protein
MAARRIVRIVGAAKKTYDQIRPADPVWRAIWERLETYRQGRVWPDEVGQFADVLRLDDGRRIRLGFWCRTTNLLELHLIKVVRPH